MICQKSHFILAPLLCALVSVSKAQRAGHFDLLQLATGNKLEVTASYPQLQTADSQDRAVTVRGILWLKDVSFDTGEINVDLRGRNVFLQSFPGIAFHARDTTAYDVVYFCPFRFHDSTRETRRYSVKYMSVPDYSYTKLRKEHPGVYENEAVPAPDPAEWFHARIVVTDDSISVFVNRSIIPSLKVKRLPTLNSGKIGLWSYSETLSSDFANFSIKE